MLQCYRMRVIRVLCLASLLALVVFSGVAEPGALADVWDGEKPPLRTEAEGCAKDENRQDSAGIKITMTGEEEDGPRASVTLVARTGSQDDC